MKKTLVLSSAAQLAGLIQNTPDLRVIPQFVPIAEKILTPPKQGGCSSCRGGGPFAQIKPMLETALSSLTDADFLKIKEILKYDEIVYFKKVNGNIVKNTV